MNVRLANKNDALNLSILAQYVWVHSYCSAGIDNTIADYLATTFGVPAIEAAINSQLVLVVEKENQLIGLALVDKQMNELQNLYVLPKFQAMGVGKALLNEVKQHCSGSFWLSCWEKNDSALKFYQSMGFVETGESFFELGGESHRNLVLTKS